MKLTKNNLKGLIQQIKTERKNCSSNEWGKTAAESHAIDLRAIAYRFEFTDEERKELIGDLTNEHWNDK